MTGSFWKPYRPAGDHSVTGDLLWRERYEFPHLGAHRPVFVWLPPSYASSDRRYPVLYMHDAQNLFDSATAYAGDEWKVDESMTALAGEAIEAIVVGVNHAGRARVHEYTPFGEAGGRAYVDFLVERLKPRIDADFRTRPERESSLIAGSSMGGLISLYAYFAHPLTFGGAGAFSPSLWVAHGAIHDLVREAPAIPGRIYLDNGTREPTARPMAQLLEEKGWTPGLDLLYVSEKGARHTESAWARRFPAAVRFLLGHGEPGGAPTCNSL